MGSQSLMCSCLSCSVGVQDSTWKFVIRKMHINVHIYTARLHDVVHLAGLWVLDSKTFSCSSNWFVSRSIRIEDPSSEIRDQITCENRFPTTFSSGFIVQAWSPPIGKMWKWLWITCRHMSSCFSFPVRQTLWALEQIIFSHLILGGLRADLWCKENLHNSFKHLALIWWCPSLWMTHSHILLYSTWMDILALYIGSWVGQEKFGTLSLSSGFIECYVEVQLLRPYMPNS
jgi:hypothetical protein